MNTTEQKTVFVKEPVRTSALTPEKVNCLRKLRLRNRLLSRGLLRRHGRSGLVVRGRHVVVHPASQQVKGLQRLGGHTFELVGPRYRKDVLGHHRHLHPVLLFHGIEPGVTPHGTLLGLRELLVASITERTCASIACKEVGAMFLVWWPTSRSHLSRDLVQVHVAPKLTIYVQNHASVQRHEAINPRCHDGMDIVLKMCNGRMSQTLEPWMVTSPP